MNIEEPFYICKGNVYAVPITHYNMEMAAHVHLVFNHIQPDCVAVELAETMQLQLLHAASRLPDISIVISYDQKLQPIYYLCEPCDAAFEGLRSGLEAQISSYCIDLDVDYYPDTHEHIPDPYAIQRIGLEKYYSAYKKLSQNGPNFHSKIDQDREMYMAKRLKELSLSHEKVLFVAGMSHIENVLKLLDLNKFPTLQHAERTHAEICTLTEQSGQEVMAEFGWISTNYENLREKFQKKGAGNAITFPPDRQKLIYQLYKEASEDYIKNTGNAFPGYHMRNIMKFVRNYALLNNQLMPNLFQILCAAKGCVDHNYAYEVWNLATKFIYHRNVDSLNELDLTINDVWGDSKIIRFHMREKGRKNSSFQKTRKNRSQINFKPPGPFSICSHPPEDLIIERFGEFLKKKGTQLLTEEGARTVPFSTSLEDGIDTKETIRHWHEKKLYIKVKGKPPGGVGSVVMIFDEDMAEDGKAHAEKYLWKTTWLGEHAQESDMAFYATPLSQNVVGPGISRCEYGGFMMSYPPRRMMDVWSDPDYNDCRSKSEVLLMAAVDYAVKPVVVYVSNKPPRSIVKSFAKRFGKKIVYIPISQLSPITLNKLRSFHVLDGRDKRSIADEYIY